MPIWIIAVIAAAAVLCLLALIVALRDGRRFIVREYRIYSDRIRAERRLVFLSDLHGREYGRENAALIGAIRRLRPDAILVGGDMIIQKRAVDGRTRWMDSAVSLLGRLAKTYPVLCANGNHELLLAEPEPDARPDPERHRACYRRYTAQLAQQGITVLRNDTVRLSDYTGASEDEGISVSGFEPEGRMYRRFARRNIDEGYVRARLGACGDGDGLHLVLSHHPAHFDAVSDWGADLVLSGHVHGGILRLPWIGGVVSPDPALFPRYTGGLYIRKKGRHTGGRRVYPKPNFLSVGRRLPGDVRDGGETLLTDGCSAMVLSCGAGMHTIPLRIFNPGEVSLIRLLPREESHMPAGHRDLSMGGRES